MSDSCYLSHELIVEVLKRLPAKSLLRFRCVNKSWFSLITDPNFIKSYNNQNNDKNTLYNKNTHILLRNYSETLEEEIYTLHSDDSSFDLRTRLEFPFFSSNPYFRIVGSCNGLICLADSLFSYDNSNYIILWNPSIRKFLNLPAPGIRPNEGWTYMTVLGFGFDSKSNDYKVVRLARDGSKNDRPGVQVFELSTRAWRVIDAVVPPFAMHQYWSLANLNGFVHWLASNPSPVGGFQCLIVAFDVSTEMFREIMLPPSLAGEDLLDLSLTVCGDSLSLCHYYQDKNRRACRIWVMKEYGVATWFELFTIDLEQGVGLALRFRRNGDVILATGEGELVSYSPKKQQVTHLGIHGSSKQLILYSGSLYLDTYVESLFSFDRVNRVSDDEAAPLLLPGEE